MGEVVARVALVFAAAWVGYLLGRRSERRRLREAKVRLRHDWDAPPLSGVAKASGADATSVLALRERARSATTGEEAPVLVSGDGWRVFADGRIDSDAEVMDADCEIVRDVVRCARLRQGTRYRLFSGGKLRGPSRFYEHPRGDFEAVRDFDGPEALPTAPPMPPDVGTRLVREGAVKS